MAKNKDSINKNRTGELRIEDLTIHHVDPKTNETTVYKIMDILAPLDGENVSLTVASDSEAPASLED